MLGSLLTPGYQIRSQKVEVCEMSKRTLTQAELEYYAEQLDEIPLYEGSEIFDESDDDLSDVDVQSERSDHDTDTEEESHEEIEGSADYPPPKRQKMQRVS